MKLSRILLITACVGLLIIAVTFIITKKKIESSLIEICDAASDRYNMLPRNALILQLSDESIPVPLKNRTIWAIGKMKIESTTPKLERMYLQTENPNYKYVNSKRELEKAIGYMRDGKIDLMSFEDLYK